MGSGLIPPFYSTVWACFVSKQTYVFSFIFIRLTSLVAFRFPYFIWFMVHARTNKSLFGLLFWLHNMAWRLPTCHCTQQLSHFFYPSGSVPRGDMCQAPSLGISHPKPCIECTCCMTVAFLGRAQNVSCDPLQFPPAPLSHTGCFSWVNAPGPIP